MLEGIEVLCHSSIKICRNRVIYVDPYNVEKNYNDADIIFITHDHYDHYSIDDIDKVKKASTLFVIPEEMKEKVINQGIENCNIVTVIPKSTYILENIKFDTVAAYNVKKNFHPKMNGWVGYIIEIDGIRYYVAGDTDLTEENKEVKCDIAFVPVGGTYTMDAYEAAKLINIIKPKVAVPIHYGSIVGTAKDAEIFSNLIDNDIKCKILIKCYIGLQ